MPTFSYLNFHYKDLLIFILYSCNFHLPVRGNALNGARFLNFLFKYPCKEDFFDRRTPMKFQNITGIFLYNSNNHVMNFL